MAQRDLPEFLCRLRNGLPFYLAFFWVTGFMAGIQVYLHSFEMLASLMRGTLYADVSIVGSLIFAFLPFLFSAFAVFYCVPYWILPIAAVKAFLVAFTSIGLCHSLGNAGWLYAWFVLFCDWLMMPALYFFWLRRLTGAKRSLLTSVFMMSAGYYIAGGIGLRMDAILAGMINLSKG